MPNTRNYLTNQMDENIKEFNMYEEEDKSPWIHYGWVPKDEGEWFDYSMQLASQHKEATTQ
eukprot:5847975-Pyramimonas_sp.AAC.1